MKQGEGKGAESEQGRVGPSSPFGVIGNSRVCRRCRSFMGILHCSWRGALDVSLFVVILVFFCVSAILHCFAA